MLANNLYNILNGRYYLEDEKFIIDPKVIPVSGLHSYDARFPKSDCTEELCCSVSG
jgi:hypothetical protein